MTTLNTQSSTIKGYAELNGLVFIFSSAGVDVFRKTYAAWEKVAFASLPNVTCGTVNELGIWLGTSDSGVWFVGFDFGDLSGRLRQYYATTGTTVAIRADNINALDGLGSALVIAHASGAEYLPDPGTVYKYSDGGGCGSCAINDTYIAYSVSNGFQILAHPSSDWVQGDTTVINESSTPAISDNTVNAMRYGDGDNLFLATGDGIDIYNASLLGSELITGTDSDMSGSNNWTQLGLTAFDINTTVSGKMFMLSGGTTDAAVLDTVEAGKVYYVTLKIKNSTAGGGSGASTAIRIGGNLAGVDGLDYFEVTPTATEQTFSGFFTRGGTATNLVVGGTDGSFVSGTAVEVDDVSCKESLALSTIFSGEIDDVWPSSLASTTTGIFAYINSSDDVVIYDMAGAATLNTNVGTYTHCWVDNQAGLSLSDEELDRFASIDFLSPAKSAINVPRDWVLYLEVTDSLDDITTAANVILKVDGVTVAPTKTAITDGYKLEYTPASASGYRKEVQVELTVTDDNSNVFTETYSFVTVAAGNAAASATKPPNVVVYKDLSLTEHEDLYGAVEVNWNDEKVWQFFVSEDQAQAFGAVAVENGIYHATTLTVRVPDKDAAANSTQDIQRGDLLTVDCSSLSLAAQKCEVLSKQRVVQGDRIEYDLTVAFYEVWA